MTQDSEKNNMDNRWWEFYFVRYFVGTAIGGVVVLFLVTSKSPVMFSQGELASILKLLEPGRFESGYIILLAAVGLAFCYVASAPILVLHAIRGSLLNTGNSMNGKLITIFWGAVLVISVGLCAKLWSELSVVSDPLKSSDFFLGAMVLCIAALIFVVQIFLFWRAWYEPEQYAYKYYEDLSLRRASADRSGKEYVESYRHLREHGNAFFIVLLELFFGAVLFYFPSSWGVALLLWVAPAALVWFFGTRLECRNFPSC